MPCSSEHLEPTARERELKKVAKLLVKMNKLVGNKVSHGLRDQARHVYGKGPSDVDTLTAALCSLCQMNEIKLKTAAFDLKPDALQIARWWVRHKKFDEERS